MLTNAVQHLVINAAKTKTVQQDFVDSRIPNASKTAAFRKLTRPSNKTAIAAKINLGDATKPLLVNTTAVLQQFNKDESDATAVRSAKVKEPPLGALPLETVATAIDQAISTYQSDPKNVAVNALVDIIQEHVITASAALNKVQLQQKADAVAGLSAAAKNVLKDFITNITTQPVAVVSNGVTVVLEHSFFETQFGSGIEKKAIDNILLKDSSANGSPGKCT